MARSKVSVTDELLDAYVNRPLAAYIVRAVAGTSVTPNQLTLLSAACGTVAGICFALPHPVAPVAGAAALLLTMIVDCSDGQLARVRGGGSVLGRILDGYADYWVALCVHVGIVFGLGHAGAELFGHRLDGLERFLLMLGTGISMAINSGRFDRYKQRYLAHTGGGGEPETPQMYREEADRCSSRLAKLALRAFAHYVALLQKGDAHAAGVAAARRTASDPARVERFARDNGTLVRLWSFSGPTMHFAAVCAAACLVPVEPRAFMAYCFFAIVVLNAYAVVLWALQRRVLRREHAPVA